MALNVNKITSTLAKLGDPELQQYAQMHKNDPYIMALAMSESNRRKEMRAASQAPEQQEQPKVVDQMVAEMAPQQLPENQGIGQLPAGNMNFAGGGIIAFADGGGVERYQSGGMPYDPYAYGSSPLSAEQQEALKARAKPPQLTSMTRDLVAQAKFKQMNGLPLLPEEKVALQSPTTPAAQASAPAVSTAVSTAEMAAKASASPYVTADPAAATPPASSRALLNQADKAARSNFDVYGGKAAPAAATGRTAPGAGLGAAAAAAAPKDDPFSMASIKKAQDEALGESKYQIGALNNQLVEIRNKAETQVQQRLDDRKKEIESEGDVYKDRSDRLVARGKELAGQKEQNMGLALLNAGLAIMSTPGGLATALGKGAQVGTAQYAAGIKDLRAAQERLDEANDRISELRMNRKDLNSREIRALEKDRDAAILDGQKMVFGFAKDVYGMDRKQAENTFTSYMSGQEKKATIDAERQNTLIREGGANARATMPTGTDRTAMLLGTGKTDAERLESGLKKMQEITADKSGMAAVKLLAETNAKLAPGEPKVTMTDLLAGAREFSALMYPKVGNVAPTRNRP